MMLASLDGNRDASRAIAAYVNAQAGRLADEDYNAGRSVESLTVYRAQVMEQIDDLLGEALVS
jgi:hypothetical protein